MWRILGTAPTAIGVQFIHTKDRMMITMETLINYIF